MKHVPFYENIKQFDRSMETVIEDLILVSKTDSQKIEDLFQEYISNGFNETNSARTIRTHYSIISTYLKYRKVTIDKDDLRLVLSFPRVSYEELVPMNREIIRKWNVMVYKTLIIHAQSFLP